MKEINEEEEYMACANCGIWSVPVTIGYCCKACYEEDKKANEDARLERMMNGD